MCSICIRKHIVYCIHVFTLRHNDDDEIMVYVCTSSIYAYVYVYRLNRVAGKGGRDRLVVKAV